MRTSLNLVLLVPLLVSSSVLPQAHGPRHDINVETNDAFVSSDPESRAIDVALPSPFGADSLSLKFQVYPSEAACGYGNITLNDQKLSQTLDEGLLTGAGSFYSTNDRAVAASWSFQCVEIDGQPEAQLFKLTVDAIESEDVEDTGFTVLFLQAGNAQIIEVDVSSSAVSDDWELESERDLQDELDELEYLESQLSELKYLIHEKKMVLASLTGEYTTSVSDCDSLLCVIEVLGGKAKAAARKILGGPESESAQGFPHFPGHHPSWPHHGKKHGNHSCHRPPAHGNHSHPHPPFHGNHSHPHPPHHRKPHFPHLPLPICRYPPPPHHRPGHRHPPPPPPPPPHHRPKRPPHHRPERPPHHGDDSTPPPPPPRRHGRPPFHPRPPPGRSGQTLFQFSGPEDDGLPPPPPPPPHRRPHHRPILLIHLATVAVVVFLLKLLHIRFFLSPAAKLQRQARRAERQHRRSIRRSARREALLAFLNRVRSRRAGDPTDEEKVPILSDKHADEEQEEARSMTDEIAGLRNAVQLVGDLVSVQDARLREENLPAYEDSEFDSVVDGCRYTPGSSDYTPSDAGSASDILGRDAKQ